MDSFDLLNWASRLKVGAGQICYLIKAYAHYFYLSVSLKMMSTRNASWNLGKLEVKQSMLLFLLKVSLQCYFTTLASS